MDAPSEPNTLAAASVFLAAIVTDALTALDPVPRTEVPTSMRTSAIVLIACVASPPIRDWLVWEQRVAIAIPLVCVAFAGWHEQGPGTRLGDATYVALALGACVGSFWGGDGQKNRPHRSRGAPPFLRREALASLAIAMLFYASVRTLRHALRHPVNVLEYRVVSTAYDGSQQHTVGYAFASSTTASSLAFGAAAGAGTAVALGANSALRERGTGAATLLLCGSAFLQIAAAFVATMSASEQLVRLPAIFSAGACGDATLCAPAWHARRFAVVNGSAAGAWLCALGTLLLAFAPTIRLRTRAAMASARRNFELTVYGAVGVLTCVATAISYLRFSGAAAVTDYAVVGALLAVAAASFLDVWSGAALFMVAIGADLAHLWSAHGAAAIFSHATHCLNALLVLLLAAYVGASLGTELLWRCMPRGLVDALDRATGVVAVAGTSLATLLFLGSASLYSAYDGQLVADGQYRAADNRYERTVAIFIAEHFLPLLLWLPLYGCRCEVEQLSARTRALAWYLAPLPPLALWIAVAAGSGRALSHAHGWYASAPFYLSLFVCTLAPWAAVAWA